MKIAAYRRLKNGKMDKKSAIIGVIALLFVLFCGIWAAKELAQQSTYNQTFAKKSDDEKEAQKKLREKERREAREKIEQEKKAAEKLAKEKKDYECEYGQKKSQLVTRDLPSGVATGCTSYACGSNHKWIAKSTGFTEDDIAQCGR